LQNLGYDLNNLIFKKVGNDENLIIHIKASNRNIIGNNEENLKEYLKDMVKVTRT
jgi:hypothetical protein